MTDLEKFVNEQVSTILSDYDNLQLRATVSDSSYSIEFFVFINGEKKQCYELVDDGMIDERSLDNVLLRIATFLRKTPNFKRGAINKFTF